MIRRVTAGIVVSLALHAGLVGALTAVVATTPSPSAGRLSVDLSVIPKSSHPKSDHDKGDMTTPGVATDVGSIATVPHPPGRRGPERPGRQNRMTTPSSGPVADNAATMSNAPSNSDEQRRKTSLVAAVATTGTDIAPGFATGDSADAGNGSLPAVGTQASNREPADTSPGRGRGSNDGSGRAMNDDDPVLRYAMLVRKALERRGAYPGTARRLGLEGDVRLILRIDAQGAVSDTSIERSSGHPELDRAALASAGRIGLLPPPPGNRPVDILVPVRFSMRRL